MEKVQNLKSINTFVLFTTPKSRVQRLLVQGYYVNRPISGMMTEQDKRSSSAISSKVCNFVQKL
jgi:hypothetical protein